MEKGSSPFKVSPSKLEEMDFEYANTIPLRNLQRPDLIHEVTGQNESQNTPTNRDAIHQFSSRFNQFQG